MVSHDILLKKFKYYGIRGLPLNWFKSYFSGRCQCVKINNAKSDNETIVCGVPQGSDNIANWLKANKFTLQNT